MKRIMILLVMLASIDACVRGGADSEVARAKACVHILEDSEARVDRILPDGADSLNAVAQFRSFAAKIRRDASGLSASDPIRIAAGEFAALYDAAASRIATSGFNAKAIGGGIAPAGKRLVADCRK